MVIALFSLRSWDHLRASIEEVARAARRVKLVMHSPGKPLQDPSVVTPIDCLILFCDGWTKVQAIHVEMGPLTINACVCRGTNGIGSPGILCLLLLSCCHPSSPPSYRCRWSVSSRCRHPLWNHERCQCVVHLLVEVLAWRSSNLPYRETSA